MSVFKKKHLLLSSHLLIGAMLVLTLSMCRHVGPPPPHNPEKHTISISVGTDECMGAPPFTFASAGDTLSFKADTVEAVVKRLTQGPIVKDPRHPKAMNAGKLTNQPQDNLTVDQGSAGKVIIADNANGVYRIELSCGGHGDAPPIIIVR